VVDDKQPRHEAQRQSRAHPHDGHKQHKPHAVAEWRTAAWSFEVYRQSTLHRAYRVFLYSK
jgi:hypothetical protein